MGVQVPPPALLFRQGSTQLIRFFILVWFVSAFAGCAHHTPIPEWKELSWSQWLHLRGQDHQRFISKNGSTVRAYSRRFALAAEEDAKAPVKLKKGFLTIERRADETLPRLRFLDEKVLPTGDEIVLDQTQGTTLLKLDALRINEAEDKVAAIVNGLDSYLCIYWRSKHPHSCISAVNVHDVVWLDNETILTSVRDTKGNWTVEAMGMADSVSKVIYKARSTASSLLFKKQNRLVVIEDTDGSHGTFCIVRDARCHPLPPTTVAFDSQEGDLHYLTKDTAGRYQVKRWGAASTRKLRISNNFEAVAIKVAAHDLLLVSGYERCVLKVYQCRPESGTCILHKEERPSLFIASTDGRSIPVKLHEAKLEKGVLLRFYGAYGERLPPLSELHKNLISAGITIADVGIRGGGECGPAWKAEGSGRFRERSVEDLKAAIRHFKAHLPHLPLFLMTRSAGAVAGTIAANEMPSSVRGLIFEAPFISLKDWATSEEARKEFSVWGDPSNAEDQRVINRLQARLSGLKVPSYIWVGGIDDRVPIEWIRPWVDQSQARVVLHVDREAGHDGPTSEVGIGKLYAEEISFILSML